MKTVNSGGPSLPAVCHRKRGVHDASRDGGSRGAGPLPAPRPKIFVNPNIERLRRSAFSNRLDEAIAQKLSNGTRSFHRSISVRSFVRFAWDRRGEVNVLFLIGTSVAPPFHFLEPVRSYLATLREYCS